MKGKKKGKMTPVDIQSGEVVDWRSEGDAPFLSISPGPNLMVPPGKTNWVMPVVSEQFLHKDGQELVVGDLLIGSDLFVEMMLDLPNLGMVKMKHFPGEKKAWLQFSTPVCDGVSELLPRRELHWRSTPWNIGGVAMSFGKAGSPKEGDERDG